MVEQDHGFAVSETRANRDNCCKGDLFFLWIMTLVVISESIRFSEMIS